MKRTSIMTERQKYELRGILWGMVDWLLRRGCITKEQAKACYEDFDVLSWPDGKIERFMEGIPRILKNVKRSA